MREEASPADGAERGAAVGAKAPGGDGEGDGEGEGEGVPWSSPAVRAVLASTALGPLGAAMLGPALPAIRDAFGLTDAAASLVVSAYFATGIVLSPAIGSLADRTGRRPVLLGGLVTFGAAGAAVPLAPGFAGVLALRGVQGAAVAAVYITTVTVVADAFEGVQRNAVLGANAAVLTAAAAVYPVVGGALVGHGWSVPFAVYLLAFPVAAFVARTLPPLASASASPGQASARGGSVGRVLGTLGLRDAVTLYGAAFAVDAVFFGAAVTSVPFVLAGTHAVSPVAIGFVLAATMATAAVFAALNGRFARRARNLHLVGVGLLAHAVGLAVAAAGDAAWFVVAGSVVLGAGTGLCLPSVDAAVSARVSGQIRAGALSLRNSATFLGRATGPLAFTAAATATGGAYGPVFLFAAAFAGASALLLAAAPLR